MEQRYNLEDIAFLPVRENNAFAKSLTNLFGIDDPDKLVTNTVYPNGEYCPTIHDLFDLEKEGKRRLDDKIACIVWSYTKEHTHTEQVQRIVIMANAARHAGAKEIILIAAEHGFDRQDHLPDIKDSEEYKRLSIAERHKIDTAQGQPFTIEAIVEQFHAAKIRKALTISAHSPVLSQTYTQIYGYDALYNLDPVPIAVDYFLNSLYHGGEKDGENLVLVAPDKGAWDMVDRFYQGINLPNAARVYFDKWRTEPANPLKLKVEIAQTSSNFKDINKKGLLVLDDKMDGGGTLVNSVIGNLIRNYGFSSGPKEIHAFISHALLSSLDAYVKIRDHHINLHAFNTHPNLAFKKKEPGVGNIFVIDITPYFAHALVKYVIPEKPLEPIELENAGQFYEVMKLERKTEIIEYPALFR